MIKGRPLAASRDHPCLHCPGRVVLVPHTQWPGLYRWCCSSCGLAPDRQWWPTGRGIPLIGKPFPISSLDRPNPKFLGHSDGRSQDPSQMAEEYRRDTEWVAREATRFQKKPQVFA